MSNNSFVLSRGGSFQAWADRSITPLNLILRYPVVQLAKLSHAGNAGRVLAVNATEDDLEWIANGTATPNTLTVTNAGGASPGAGFNGSSAVTIDYSTVGALGKANNLSDIPNAGTARTSLGLGTAATQSINAIRQLAVSTASGATYTLSSSDIWAHVRFTNGSAITLTVNTSHGFSAGDRCRFTAAGAGQVTMSPSGVTLNSRDSALKSAGQYAVWELECVGTNEFDVLGDVTT